LGLEIFFNLFYRTAPMHLLAIWRARSRRAVGIFSLSFLILVELTSLARAQGAAPFLTELGGAKGLQAVLFPGRGEWPWIRLGVADARRERLKVGFFHVGLIPVLVLRQVSLDLDLARFETTTARLWLQNDFGLANPRSLQVGPIRITLRREKEILWECTAKEMTFGQADGLTLRQVVVHDGSGAILTADSLIINLAPAGNQLQVELRPAEGKPIAWNFTLPPPPN
jgi:hypothetical protein